MTRDRNLSCCQTSWVRRCRPSTSTMRPTRTRLKLRCLARSSLRTPQKSQTGVTLPVELQDNRAGLKERSQTRMVTQFQTLASKCGKQTTTVSTTYNTPTAAYQGALICTPMRTGTITFGVLPQRLIRFPTMAQLGKCLMLRSEEHT